MANNKVVYGLLKKFGVDPTGMSPTQAWKAWEDLKKKGNESNKEYRQNTDYKQILEDKDNSDLPSKPKKYPRTKELTSKVMYLYSSNRKEIEKYGSVTTKICTIEYIYTVEIIGFAGGYKILSRRKNK